MFFAGSERSHEKRVVFSSVDYINKVSGAGTVPRGYSSHQKDCDMDRNDFSRLGLNCMVLI
jgi:hypothetical protein